MKFLISFLFLCLAIPTFSQEDGCNKFGVWLWHFEDTQYPTHGGLADRVKAMGAKRIYVKVADGRINPEVWPEVQDTELVKAYHDRGLEAWAWSYNYKNNTVLQAEALYEAAKTGYDGYVIDIEIEFNGESAALQQLLMDFDAKKKQAIADGHIDEDFKFYVTTWGNPSNHNYRIDILDRFVDAYMPQTYVEEWAGDHLVDITKCVEEAQAEYESLGATKPLHHILSTAQQILDEDGINEFFAASGPESSLWRIPGAGVSQLVWDTWYAADWEMDFCDPLALTDQEARAIEFFPNPVYDVLNIKNISQGEIILSTVHGKVLTKKIFAERQETYTIPVNELMPGMYVLSFKSKDQLISSKFLKL